MEGIDIDKIKLLVFSDWGDTGFGRVMKELLPRLAKTGKYEICMIGWVYSGNSYEYDQAKELGIRLEMTHFWEGRDRFGAIRANEIIPRFQPNIVFSLGDVWMIDWISQNKHRKQFNWVLYTPIDRDYLSQYWLQILKDPEALVLYSKFGEKIVNRQIPNIRPYIIMHGVDTTIFHPIKNRQLLRKDVKFDQDEFIVGQCCRNQLRKSIPRTFKMFKAFNCKTFFSDRTKCQHDIRCDLCQNFEQDERKKKTRLYLHMTDGSDANDGRGISWNLNELAKRFKVRPSVTPGLSVSHGLSSVVLNKIYNLFDVHLLTTKREGFGLPILESMAAGIPNIATDYSSCSELLEGGGGLGIKIKAFLNDPDDEAESAICDIEDGAEKLEYLFNNPEKRKEIAQKSRKYAEKLTWDVTIPQWEKVFDSVM